MPLTSPGKFKTDANGNSYGGNGVGVNFLATALDNTLVGANAGAALTDGDRNSILGSGAGAGFTTASENVAIGYNAYPLQAAGIRYSVVVGALAAPLFVGAFATIIGHSAGSDVAGAPDVTLIGYNAGRQRNTQTTCIGSNAGYRGGGVSIAAGNTFIGAFCGQSSLAAEMTSVTAIGDQCAGNGNATSAVFIGNGAGSGTANGSQNKAVAIGVNAGSSHICTDSVFIGFAAGNGQGASSFSVAVGSQALDNIANGQHNVAIGYNSLGTANAGGSNVAVGSGAGALVNGGAADNNTMLGKDAGATTTNGGNNILIGKGVVATTPTTSDEVKLGNILTAVQTSGLKRVLIDGGLQLRYLSRSVTQSTSDETIVGCTANNITLTIPTAQIGFSGRKWVFKDETGTALALPITINCQGGQTIDGAASVQILVNYGKVTLYSNGVNLFTI